MLPGVTNEREPFSTAQELIVKHDLLPRETVPPGPLYHYTTPEGLLGILRSGALHFTHAEHLNDPEEQRYGIRLLRDVGARVVQASYDTSLLLALLEQECSLHASIPRYVTSLSEARSQLSQWRAYTPRGGYSIGFDGPRFAEQLRKEGPMPFGPVLYDTGRQLDQLTRFLEDFLGRWKADRPEDHFSKLTMAYDTAFARVGAFTFGQLLPFWKAPAFAEEKEWRAVTEAVKSKVEFRVGRAGLRPFISVPIAEHPGDPMPITEIIVSPIGDAVLAEHSARLLVRSLGYSEDIVKAPTMRVR